MILKSGSFLLILLMVAQAKAVVWKAENSWNDVWEKKYSEWISTTVNPSFLKENLISTDCADAVIATRWIFARENLLPAASSVGSSKLISNLSNSWDNYSIDVNWKKDKRFLQALKDIINSTNSKTLYQDTYPVILSSKYLVPGTLFVNATKESGHAEWISKMSFDGMQAPIMFNSSTVPQLVRDLLVYPFMKIKWPEKNKNGFVKFRWVVLSNNSVSLKSADAMPGYSNEQYELGVTAGMDFDDYVTTRLIGHPIDGINKLQILVSHLTERFENRVPIVQQGFEVCGNNKCPESTSKFYDHSTYSRDGAIVFLIQGIFELIYSDRYLNVDDQMAGQMTLKWSQLQSDIMIEIQNKNYSLGQLVSNWNLSLFSSDPNVSIEKRWGIE
ncbi:MAG: hypothetical protein WA160_12685 [Pseudobdellovibrio sp.]